MVDPTSAPAAPLARAAAVVGDRWSLLIVNALLDGPRRFGELLESLPGIASNVLSSRLKQLEHQGVLVALPYSRRPARFSYQLTAAGIELAGVLQLLAQWAVTQGADVEPIYHARCGTPVEPRWYCPTCAELVDVDAVSEDHFL